MISEKGYRNRIPLIICLSRRDRTEDSSFLSDLIVLVI